MLTKDQDTLKTESDLWPGTCPSEARAPILYRNQATSNTLQPQLIPLKLSGLAPDDKKTNELPENESNQYNLTNRTGEKSQDL